VYQKEWNIVNSKPKSLREFFRKRRESAEYNKRKKLVPMTDLISYESLEAYEFMKDSYAGIDTKDKTLYLPNGYDNEIIDKIKVKTLEEKNLLYRTHGGAVKRSSARGSEESVAMKRSEYLAEKKETAKYINQSIIQSGQTIYLDAGTSTYELIDYLRDKRITVVTNSTYHLSKLINNKIHTIILGGTLKHSTQAVVGPAAIEQLKNYSFDMCFIGCNGVDENFGVTTADESEARI